MVGDIFVGALLVISGCINLLAIGAFWVTPSLRTTANRFVINLLLVNFISCLILSPFAFNVNANSPASAITSLAKHNESKLAGDEVKVDNLTAAECSNHTATGCIEVSIKLLGNESSRREHIDDDERSIENIFMIKYQSWSLDLVVALSVLAVLLVVMDTFIAVTDPLRYHSRISDLKAWFLIAFSWIFGVSFGVASALRTHEGVPALSADFEEFDDNNIYNMMFLLAYFLSIIITPFLLVILMYWRIYSEARENSQRMRQNGSSPLLQSALNLAATATAHQHQSTILTSPQCLLLVTSSPQTNKLNTMNKQQPTDNGGGLFQHQVDGLTMKIDKQDYYSVNNNNISQQINLNGNHHLPCFSHGVFSDNTTFLLSSPPHELMPMLSTIDETTPSAPKSQQHQNILLTLTTACDQTIKRNHSAKHLLTEANLFDDVNLVELRQVRSTPNLQKLADSPSEIMSCNHQEQTLELPSIQASPKALRYMTSLRHRLSNASSLFKYREEGRAARISILGEHQICFDIS
jgi:7 transmembrane receptor (rhodopsin family)